MINQIKTNQVSGDLTQDPLKYLGKSFAATFWTTSIQNLD